MAGSEGLIYWGALGIILISIIFLVFSTSQIAGKVDSVKKISEENSKKLIEMQKEYSKLAGSYTTIESSINAIFRENEENFSSLEMKISTLEKSIQNIKTGVENLSGSLESVKKREYGNEITLRGLRSYISSVDSKLENFRGSLSDLENSLNLIKSELNLHSKKLRDLSFISDDLRDKVLYLEGDRISSIDGKIRELNRELNSLFRMIDVGGKDPIVSPFVVLIINRGDTILEISKAFGVSMQNILSMNNISDPRKLMVGDKLKIPVSLKDVITLPFSGLKKGSVVRGMNESGWIRFKVDGDVRAVLPGRVDEVKEKYVRLYHGNEVYTSYKFDGDIEVEKGSWVRSGQTIGECREYLDFAFLINNEPRDPFKYIFDKVGDFSATFYTEWEDGILPEQASFKVTKSGNLVEKWWTVAADPKIIPLGSYVYIPQLSRMPGGGVFHVEDIGSAIKKKRIDIYVGDLLLALKLWKKDVTVYVMRQDRQ